MRSAAEQGWDGAGNMAPCRVPAGRSSRFPYLCRAKIDKLERKVKVAAVSYLNTKPLLYGFDHHPVGGQIILSTDYPSRIGAQLLAGEVDLGLIPVALIPELPEYHVLPGFCIGAEGPVASVCLFSEVPLEEIKAVYLDYQSRSSAALARYLFRHHWRQSPRWLPAAPGFEAEIRGTTAGVVIGDRALQQRQQSPYIYDLAEAWITHTGLPMVFAAWVSNKPLPETFTASFIEATGMGTHGTGLEAVIAAQHCPFFDIRAYYTRHISYPLTAAKMEGVERFVAVVAQQAAEPAQVGSAGH